MKHISLSKAAEKKVTGVAKITLPGPPAWLAHAAISMVQSMGPMPPPLKEAEPAQVVIDVHKIPPLQFPIQGEENGMG